MGGGFVCDNDIKKDNFISPDSNIPKDTSQKIDLKNNNNKIPKNNNYIFSNILENSPDRKAFNKRLSDFHNFERRAFEKNNNVKNFDNKNLNIEGKNTSSKENSFLNQKNNDELNKNNNSSFFNGSNIYPGLTSKQQNNEIIEEEENDSINNNNNNNFNNIDYKIHSKTKIFSPNRGNSGKLNANMKKNIKKPDSNINCNLGENNFIFINISRGSVLLNPNKLASRNTLGQFESTTPKMMIEKENLDKMANGNKKLFSHFIQKDSILPSQTNNNKIIKDVFYRTFDMNRYSEEMLNVINTIRTNPDTFIKEIDYIINNNINKTSEGTFLISNDVDEKIKLTDNYIEMIEKTKSILKKWSNSPNELSKLKKIKYNDELEIILDESAYEEIGNDYPEIDIKDIPAKLNIIYDENGIDDNVDIDFGEDKIDNNDVNFCKYNENVNIVDFGENENKEKFNKKESEINKEKNIKMMFKKKPKLRRKHNYNNILDLNDDKIGNLILEKRKEIKSKYPKNIFKISVIKDIRINILFQISMEEFFRENNRKTLTEIIFDPQYTSFAVSWTNELNRNFISISCFA